MSWELMYWFATAATFLIVATESDLVWTPQDPIRKRLFVAAVVAPFWPILWLTAAILFLFIVHDK
jgi:hypothetical protein